MDPFIGEIRMFAGSFAPNGWQFCNGQLLPISQYAALFSILGTTYGGNGTTNFQLPDLRSRVPIHAGQGNGLSPFIPGQMAGVENIALTINNLPSHNHQATFTPSGGGSAQVNVTQTVGSLQDPTGNMLAKAPSVGPSQANVYAPPASPVSGQLAGVSGGGGGGGTVAVALTGNSLPFNIHPPLLCVNFIIALNGIFPSRN